MAKGIPIYGKKVRELRKKEHLSQATLAAKAGVSVETIKRIEKNAIAEVLIELVPRLAETLGVQTSEIEVASEGAAPPDDVPEWAKQYETLAEAQAALKRFWSESGPGKRSKAAAKSPQKGKRREEAGD